MELSLDAPRSEAHSRKCKGAVVTVRPCQWEEWHCREPRRVDHGVRLAHLATCPDPRTDDAWRGSGPRVSVENSHGDCPPGAIPARHCPRPLTRHVRAPTLAPMDLDEALARHLAADDGVSNWDGQPESFKADFLLYAQSAIRFFHGPHAGELIADIARARTCTPVELTDEGPGSYGGAL